MNTNEEATPRRGLQGTSSPSETKSPYLLNNSTSITPSLKYKENLPKKQRPVSLTRPITPDFLPSYLRQQVPPEKLQPSSHHLVARSSAYDLGSREEHEKKTNTIVDSNKENDSKESHKQSFRVTVDSISVENSSKSNLEDTETTGNLPFVFFLPITYKKLPFLQGQEKPMLSFELLQLQISIH